MKKGISLIVLVITIIVMIILAASVVITLSNTGVINKASQAVDLTNEIQVQDLAALTWADAYMDNLRGEDLEEKVVEELGKQGITEDKWNIIVTDSGATATRLSTLGKLIKGVEDYGKTVDYTVTAELRQEYWDGEHEDIEVTADKWKIYYHTEEYVYLIASEPVGSGNIYSASGTKFGVEKFVLGNSKADINTLGLNSFSDFANTIDYGNNVVGAIGGPTIELLVAGWNAKGNTPSLSVDAAYELYEIYEAEGNMENISIISDGLYIHSDSHWMAANIMITETLKVYSNGYGIDNGDYDSSIYPVVCLKSSIPATVGTTTDFSLVK